jgi:hypothetical protein
VPLVHYYAADELTSRHKAEFQQFIRLLHRRGHAAGETARRVPSPPYRPGGSRQPSRRWHSLVRARRRRRDDKARCVGNEWSIQSEGRMAGKSAIRADCSKSRGGRGARHDRRGVQPART